MAKTHLIQSDVPLVEGKTFTGACGIIVHKSAFGAWIDSENAKDLFNGVWGWSVCGRCRAMVWEKRYLYALREGQEQD